MFVQRRVWEYGGMGNERDRDRDREQRQRQRDQRERERTISITGEVRGRARGERIGVRWRLRRLTSVFRWFKSEG